MFDVYRGSSLALLTVAVYVDHGSSYVECRCYSIRVINKWSVMVIQTSSPSYTVARDNMAACLIELRNNGFKVDESISFEYGITVVFSHHEFMNLLYALSNSALPYSATCKINTQLLEEVFPSSCL